MGFVAYLPALVLNAVTPLKLSWSIAVTGGLCTLYTAVVSSTLFLFKYGLQWYITLKNKYLKGKNFQLQECYLTANLYIYIFL